MPRFQVTVIGPNTGDALFGVIEASDLIDAVRQASERGEVVQIRRMAEKTAGQRLINIFAGGVCIVGLLRLIDGWGSIGQPLVIAGLALAVIIWRWLKWRDCGIPAPWSSVSTSRTGGLLLVGVAAMLLVSGLNGWSGSAADAVPVVLSVILAATSMAVFERFPWQAGAPRPA